jgi:hypothetical protein
MTFKITEIDIETEDELGSYEEEYSSIYDLKVSTKDFISAQDIPKGKFKEQWDSIGAQGQHDANLAEKVQTFQLPFKQMNQAVQGVITFFGSMSVCEGTGKVNVTEKVHNLLMSGTFFS